MEEGKLRNNTAKPSRLTKAFVGAVILAVTVPFNLFSTSPQRPVQRPQRHAVTTDTTATSQAQAVKVDVIDDIANPDIVDSIAAADRQAFVLADSIVASIKTEAPEWEEREIEFNSDPTRAVWLSALLPGLGQVYNRRYWKLPLIVGGYLGLGYATNWNNNMLKDYTQAYNDILDNDPSTKSYMDFFPSTTREEDIDKTWLTNTLKSRKNFYRRNRDLCIIGMVGVYVLAMVDAYVDASLSHFDISPDLSMDVAPAVIQDGRNRYPSVGLQWAVNF
jgi:hypothetical protein